MLHLLILLPFVGFLLAWGTHNAIEKNAEVPAFLMGIPCLICITLWIVLAVNVIDGTTHIPVESPHPITPELRITVKDSIQDTLYIYR